MYWIDAHAHISFFDRDARRALFTRGDAQNLQYWIMAGYDSKDWSVQLDVGREHPERVAPVLGLHPWRVIEMNEREIDRELDLLKTWIPQARALGETGIDKFKTSEGAIITKQIAVFERHMELNKNHNLPLVLHVVRAENEALEVLKTHDFTGVLHGFSGSYETARRFVDLGYKISVGRGVYRTGFKQLKDCVSKLALSDLLIESDAGLDEKGAPEDAVSIYFEVAKAVAALKGVRLETVMDTNFKNAKQVFRI